MGYWIKSESERRLDLQKLGKPKKKLFYKTKSGFLRPVEENLSFRLRLAADVKTQRAVLKEMKISPSVANKISALYRLRKFSELSMQSSICTKNAAKFVLEFLQKNKGVLLEEIGSKDPSSVKLAEHHFNQAISELGESIQQKKNFSSGNQLGEKQFCETMEVFILKKPLQATQIISIPASALIFAQGVAELKIKRLLGDKMDYFEKEVYRRFNK